MSSGGGKGGNGPKTGSPILHEVLLWPVSLINAVQGALKKTGSMNSLVAPGVATFVFFYFARDAQQPMDYLIPYLAAGGSNYALQTYVM